VLGALHHLGEDANGRYRVALGHLDEPLCDQVTEGRCSHEFDAALEGVEGPAVVELPGREPGPERAEFELVGLGPRPRLREPPLPEALHPFGDGGGQLPDGVPKRPTDEADDVSR
jgi:hypothetical protein